MKVWLADYFGYPKPGQSGHKIYLKGNKDMEVEFISSIEDHIAFTLYEYQTNPQMQKQINQGRLRNSIFILCFGVVASSAIGHQLILPGLILSIILTVFYFFYSKLTYGKWLRNYLKNNYYIAQNDLQGNEKIIITPESIIDEMPYGAIKVFWKYVKKIIEEKDFFYIYYGAGRAIFIPNKAFSDIEQRSQFVELANRYWKDSKMVTSDNLNRDLAPDIQP